MYFTDIRTTEHYKEYHADDVPWDKVVELIYTTKNPRKKGHNYEIEQEGYYVLFELKNNVIYVINAKKEVKK